ncbi:P-loop containing nucleoside triphosphate hydrolase protein [Paraphoma chrysanthemicola]|uniref:P-loop containing nucleoside triphosphate hydrolase protein n=1 Tax=Paraphoma chrysanthemicola TaxID=798071 RepID=A0A8K0RF16_9PLEO|nr:P-loop containing nucleoside triphosphate hydrolase protein [Paraphoma chrysanthemicola]
MVPSPTKMDDHNEPERLLETIDGKEQQRPERLRREVRRLGAAIGSRVGARGTEIAGGDTLDQARSSSEDAMIDQSTTPTIITPTERLGRRSGGRVRRGRPLQVRSGADESQSPTKGYANRSGGISDELIPSSPSRSVATSVKRPTSALFKQESIKPAVKVYDHFNMYWETYPPTIQQLARADTFFIKDRKSPQLLSSAAKFRKVPDSDVPEVAFVGRSNVGKSSLLNAVVGANVKDLVARTSATRGFTKTMNFYGIATGSGVKVEKDGKGREKIVGQGGLVIVDMPGYGEGSITSWGVEIMKYIQSRKQLRRVFVLLDAEHGIKDKDRSLLASLRLVGVSHQVILSKMDKLYIPKATDIKHFDKKKGVRLKPQGKVETLHAAMEKLKPEIKPPVGGGALGELLACSSEIVVDKRRLGIDHVRYAVLKAVGLDVAPASWSRPEKHQLGEMEEVRKVKALTYRNELKSRGALKARRERKRPFLPKGT